MAGSVSSQRLQRTGVLAVLKIGCTVQGITRRLFASDSSRPNHRHAYQRTDDQAELVS